MHGLSSKEYSVFVSVINSETYRLSKGDTNSSNTTTNKSTIDVHSEVQLPLQSTIQIKTLSDMLFPATFLSVSAFLPLILQCFIANLV